MALYNLDEATEIIKLETGFGITPRILCDFGRIDEGKLIRVFIAYKGKATSTATGDIDIPSGRYFEVLPIILFEFEMDDSIKIPVLFDAENGDTLLIEPPIIATIDKLRVDVSDVRCIINEGIALVKQRLHNQKLAQALINSNHPQAEAAPIIQDKIAPANGESKSTLNLKEMWIDKAQELGKDYIAKWRKAGYEPTTSNVGLYVEGVFSDKEIYNTNGNVIDRATIIREALTGITGNKQGHKLSKPKIPKESASKLPSIK